MHLSLLWIVTLTLLMFKLVKLWENSWIDCFTITLGFIGLAINIVRLLQ